MPAHVLLTPFPMQFSRYVFSKCESRDSKNRAGETFGLERLHEVIVSYSSEQTNLTLLDYLHQKVEHFTKGVQQRDDITILLISMAEHIKKSV